MHNYTNVCTYVCMTMHMHGLHSRSPMARPHTSELVVKKSTLSICVVYIRMYVGMYVLVLGFAPQCIASN